MGRLLKDRKRHLQMDTQGFVLSANVMPLKVDMLDEKGATFHPLEGDPSLHLPGHLPRAYQPVQVLKVGVWLGLLMSQRAGVNRQQAAKRMDTTPRRGISTSVGTLPHPRAHTLQTCS